MAALVGFISMGIIPYLIETGGVSLLLMETGDRLLLENNDNILLE